MIRAGALLLAVLTAGCEDPNYISPERRAAMIEETRGKVRQMREVEATIGTLSDPSTAAGRQSRRDAREAREEMERLGNTLDRALDNQQERGR